MMNQPVEQPNHIVINFAPPREADLAATAALTHRHRWAWLNAGGMECYDCGARP